ncbi:MAG TPA: hypothetical protein DIS84_07515 [Corynebacterium stationis]|nr:hypothetical protein [Corynebacterium stationis]
MLCDARIQALVNDHLVGSWSIHGDCGHCHCLSALSRKDLSRWVEQSVYKQTVSRNPRMSPTTCCGLRPSVRARKLATSR